MGGDMQNDLEKLIAPILDELLKEKPSQAQIKKMMAKAGLEYSKDQYNQLKNILGSLENEHGVNFDDTALADNNEEKK